MAAKLERATKLTLENKDPTQNGSNKTMYKQQNNHLRMDSSLGHSWDGA